MTYEILAIRYAHLDRKAAENFLNGDDHRTDMPIDYFVWAIRGEGRVIVVDTGFDAPTAAARGRQLLRPVAEGLAAIGIDAGTVEDVVVTHMHYDHAGNVPLFARARFHLQDAEMAYCTGRSMGHRLLSAPFAANDVAAMVHRIFEGRVVFHDGEDELAPGITLHRVPGHTPGLQAVRVETARGPVLLASDAMHFWANLERRIPFPILVDLAGYMEGLQTVGRLVPSIDHCIPGHDPLVLARFPAEPGTADIVRLDLPPREAA
jgi:glyoxylase-like metal-dependent hydrolase (beta-lactamase superfamily II)